MLPDALTVSFTLHLLLLCADVAQASPSLRRSPSSPSRALHIPLLRRAPPERNDTELGVWAKQQKQLLEGKYGQRSTTSTKRSSGYNLCV
jgi:predicted component of type VI protein secretion system